MRASTAAMGLLALASLIGIAAGLTMSFLYAPTERTMGDVQRIFYFHVPLAWVAFVAFFAAFVAGIGYLATRSMRFDLVGSASAEIGTLFTTLVLATGSIWAKKAWNTWWTWEPRLTTMLILWLIYFGYLTARGALEEPERRARVSAVIAVVGFVNVPIVYMSIRWWRSMHPLVITRSGFAMEGSMVATLMVSLAGFTALYGFLLLLRIQLGEAQADVEAVQARVRDGLEEAHAPGAGGAARTASHGSAGGAAGPEGARGGAEGAGQRSQPGTRGGQRA